MNLHKSALFVTTALSLGIALPAAVPAAHAQTSNGQPLEEIVVTARRVEERAQTVPISMSVFNQRQLTDRNISSAQDLGIATPALSVTTEFGSENTVFSLRGFAQDIGTESTVGVFFADVVAPRAGVSGSQTHAGDGAGPGSFFDLQNVQVLKGPQGTLFGRNTTGGDVLLVPKKPTPDFEGYFEGSAGNYDMERIQAVVNLPVNDKVRLRLGVDQQTRDGYMKNISGVGPSDFANTNYVAGRVSLVVDVTDDIENYTIGSFTQSDTNGPLEKLIACTTKGAAFIPVIGPMACNQMARDRGNFVGENSLPNANSFLRQWQIINTTTWQANDDLTVKNIASYSQLVDSLSSSLFGDNFKFGPTIKLGGPVVSTGSLAGQHFIFTGIDHPPGLPGSQQQTFTEELQVHGVNLDGKLSWQAGLYMEGSHPLGIAGSDSPFLLTCTDYLTQQCVDPVSKLVFENFGGLKTTVGNTHLSIGSITYRDYAAYGQADYAILDNLKFEAGLRVTDDSTTGQDFRPQTTYQFGQAPNNSGCQVPSTIATRATNCLLPGHVSSRAPTWVLKLTYQPDEDVMTYVSYSRGYREGGIYLTGPADSTLGSKFLTYQPETVDTYEVGAKTSFHGDVSGILDIAAFYNDFSNQQIQTGFNSTSTTPTAAIVNAGSSRIFGFDLSSTLIPYQGLTVNLDYTYLNTKLESLADVTLPPGSAYISAPGAAPGTVLPYSPHHKLSANVTYRLPVDEALGTISVGATYTYTGAQAIQPTQTFGYISSYSLVNFNVNWESIAGTPVDAEFFMTNAFDKVYQTYLFDQIHTLGFASALYGEPRMFGGRLRYHFGGASEAPPEAAPYTPPPVQAPAPVARSYMVFFDFDKSDLTPDAVKIVDQAAANAAPAKATTLTVTGHTDTVGSDAYNMRLGKRRAESVAAELEKDGIPSSEIVLVSKGKRDLLVPTKDGVREPQNRRVTIVYDGGPTS